ncbi:hypothetical protein A0J61_02370 [Choanephora cucurbitarum]|uniref:Uncharacterized protein n=1 Tax=Choanephora cucurbitarum TaxID=101091 RepID=A0A1C7NKA4_9FUNG|nr:hypothetical protein A0J61_02370 [Choanephora cucurbitarum]
MFPSWLTSWYNQQQQEQLQEPFNDQQLDTEEGEWVEVITPSTKRRQPSKPKAIAEPEKVPEIEEKRLSRQERRALARSELREQKKQARVAALGLGRSLITAK